MYFLKKKVVVSKSLFIFYKEELIKCLFVLWFDILFDFFFYRNFKKLLKKIWKNWIVLKSYMNSWFLKIYILKTCYYRFKGSKYFCWRFVYWWLVFCIFFIDDYVFYLYREIFFKSRLIFLSCLSWKLEF